MSANDLIRTRRIQREAEGYLELGMAEHAMQMLGRLGDPAAFDATSLYLWGESLRALDRYFEAVSPLERAAKADPENIHIRIALGWCYKRTGRLDLAIDALEQALIIEPSEAIVHYNLACYLSLDGQKRRSLRYLAQAFSIEPAYREMAESESDFDPLRADPEFQAVCDEARGQPQE